MDIGSASDDEPVGVAFANDQVEAEMIQGLLADAGIPSALQHLGVDGPQFGYGVLNPGGAPRRVLVRADQAEQAQALLAETLVESEAGEWAEDEIATEAEEVRGREPRSYGLIGAYARMWAWSFGLMGLAFVVFLLLYEL
jgi:hypothetical protein